MRTGLSTIQQTLTPEASNVLNRAISEAARRRHGQTTPLHVAATLLSCPSSHLRQACLRSHPNPSSSHPLQCRALELCFSVALDRLPSSSSSPALSPNEPPTPLLPPISNALMAALKRAQAHQRRGCPESQQQPLLAVKVELDHLILSILDDPSVSRVMREASFSSPAVKASIENSLSPSPSHSPPARNIYLSPSLVGASERRVVASAAGDLAKLFDILTRSEKRNPILVSDADPGVVMSEAIKQIGSPDAPAALRSVAVISAEKELSLSTIEGTQIPSKIRDLTPIIESHITGGVLTGVVLDLGDLKWLVEGVSQQQRISDVGRAAVAEINRLLVRFGNACAGVGTGLWLVGTATCATYLRCQVYFPTMESDWDLQAVPIAPRSHSLSGLLPRVGSHGILRRKLESFSTPKDFPTGYAGISHRRPSEDLDAFNKNSLCYLCKESYERELANLVDFETEKCESRVDERKSLPRWLQMAAIPSSSLQEQELMKKWRESCISLHQISLPVRSERPLNGCPLMKPGVINSIQQKPSILTTSALRSIEKLTNPAANLIKTDLALGPVQKPSTTRFTNDATSIKMLVNGLLDKFSWQAEAASAVAAAVIQSYSGAGKRRNGSPKADTWILLAGSDPVGKQKMALTLSDLVFGSLPLIIRHGSQIVASGDDAEESNSSSRGRTTIDRVADALRLNPYSMVFFEDLDRADSAVRGMLRRAIERGRLADSHGREVALGNSIFILTAGWLPEELVNSNEELRRSEERITGLATSGRQLELRLEMTRKRRHEWLFKDERLSKPRKESLSLDLNLAAGAVVDEEAGEGSLNSSDLTVEHGQEHSHGRLIVQPPLVPSSWTSELIELIDATIVFKPVDFSALRTKVVGSVMTKFTQVMGKGLSISIDEDAVDHLSGGVWLGGDSCNLFDEWIEQILVPAVEQLKGNLKLEDGVTIRLSSVKSGGQLYKSYLPASVKVAIGGVE